MANFTKSGHTAYNLGRVQGHQVHQFFFQFLLSPKPEEIDRSHKKIFAHRPNGTAYSQKTANIFLNWTRKTYQEKLESPNWYYTNVIVLLY